MIKLKTELKKSYNRRGIAFYIESLLLVLFLLGCITVLIQIFASSSRMGTQAQELTTAINLARNATESFLASSSKENFGALIGADISEASSVSDPISVWYDVDGNTVEKEMGEYRLTADVSEQDGMRLVQVTVQDENGELLYTLSAKRSDNRRTWEYEK